MGCILVHADATGAKDQMAERNSATSDAVVGVVHFEIMRPARGE